MTNLADTVRKLISNPDMEIPKGLPEYIVWSIEVQRKAKKLAEEVQR